MFPDTDYNFVDTGSLCSSKCNGSNSNYYRLRVRFEDNIYKILGTVPEPQLVLNTNRYYGLSDFSVKSIELLQNIKLGGMHCGDYKNMLGQRFCYYYRLSVEHLSRQSFQKLIKY
jgi:hypothetical protein